MNLDFAQKLGFKVWQTNVETQKIDGFTLKTFEMVIANFEIEDKIDRPKFFYEIFLIVNTKFEIILRISFLKLSNVDISFNKKYLYRRCI